MDPGLGKRRAGIEGGKERNGRQKVEGKGKTGRWEELKH